MTTDFNIREAEIGSAFKQSGRGTNPKMKKEHKAKTGSAPSICPAIMTRHSGALGSHQSYQQFKQIGNGYRHIEINN